ncbi:MAG: hypothetical protein AB1918_00875 [Pseudomonadota bacterium]
MRRALVVFVLAVLPPTGAGAGTIGQPVTVPPEVLAMTPHEVPVLALRALKAPPLEERPAGTLLDWFPIAGGFRLTGGFRDAEASDSRTGTFVPYLGIGWQGEVLDDSLLVGLDFGAFYRGRPELRVLSDGDDGPGTAYDRRTLAPSRLEPVLSITFTYLF